MGYPPLRCIIISSSQATIIHNTIVNIRDILNDGMEGEVVAFLPKLTQNIWKVYD